MRRIILVVAAFAALFLGAFAVAGWFKQREDDKRAQTAYQNQLDGCERGNILREIVFSNTSAAVEENRGTPIGGVYRKNLDALLQTPGVDPETGAVICTEVIQAP